MRKQISNLKGSLLTYLSKPALEFRTVIADPEDPKNKAKGVRNGR